MSAADTSLAALVDIASTVDPTPAPEPVTEPVTENTEPVESVEPTEAPESPESTEATPEPEQPSVDARTNPAAIRNALKALRDSDPKNAPIARALNDAYGRYTAYKESFPTVADARNAKAFLEANGGIEGLTSLHDTIKSVNETDSLLYAGDPKVLDNLIEDMRKEGKLDAFSKLAPAFLDKLYTLDEKAYFATMKPHFYQGLVDVGVPGVMQQLAKALTGDQPDLQTARGLLTEFNNWFSNLRDSIERSDRSNLDPERQKFEQERTAWQNQRSNEFKQSVATSAENYNATTLGKALKPFLKMPFFKSIASNPDAIRDLGNGIISQLRSELGADKPYQAQMNAFFAAKSPDPSRIQQYHQSKVDTIAKRIVQSVIERRYPNYSKASASPKPGIKSAAAPSPQTPGKPEFVKAKPRWEELDMDKDPSKMLFITGKGYRKADGKLITWNPKYK